VDPPKGEKFDNMTIRVVKHLLNSKRSKCQYCAFLIMSLRLFGRYLVGWALFSVCCDFVAADSDWQLTSSRENFSPHTTRPFPVAGSAIEMERWRRRSAADCMYTIYRHRCRTDGNPILTMPAALCTQMRQR